MKKLLAALIASAFATVAFAQDKMTTDDKKKAEATKPYGNTPTENKAPVVAPAKDAAPMKKDATAKDAPMAKDKKAMTKEEKKAAKAERNKVRAEKTKEDIKQDVKKP